MSETDLRFSYLKRIAAARREVEDRVCDLIEQAIYETESDEAHTALLSIATQLLTPARK